MQLKEVIMDNLYMKKAGNIGFFAVLIWFLTTIVTFGQSDKVTLEFSLSPILEQAQVLGLSSLGLSLIHI